MKKAYLFTENSTPILVCADEVKNGKYDRNEQFVDPKYEFRVQYVKGARNNGGPYFRLYYSYEEYKERYPDRADRYEIVEKMRRYDESAWHKEWKAKVSQFCALEKFIKNEKTGKYKFADAFYEKEKVCIEFQHSYISFYFEERNEFYSDLNYKVVWLYDLPHANVKSDGNGCIEILEDNARGFFRVSEKPENLKNNLVYIQVKSGLIYRVTELLRRESSTNRKSTIRYFVPQEEYTEDEFICAIKQNELKQLYALQDLWRSNFSWMIVKNIQNEREIFINCNNNGEMYRDFSKSGCISYKYADAKYGNIPLETRKSYPLSLQEEQEKNWILVKAKEKY